MRHRAADELPGDRAPQRARRGRVSQLPAAGATVQAGARPGAGRVCADESVPPGLARRLLRRRHQQRRAASHGDCRGAFQRISRLVKPGGYLVVGLYNAYSRQLHYARRALFRWTGVTSHWLDPHFGKVSAPPASARPGSRTSTAIRTRPATRSDEVLGWMDEDGLEFVNSIPKRARPGAGADEQLFAPHDPGTALSRMLSQLGSWGTAIAKAASSS